LAFCKIKTQFTSPYYHPTIINLVPIRSSSILQDQVLPPTDEPLTIAGNRDEIILNHLKAITPSLPSSVHELDFFSPQSTAAFFILREDPMKVNPYDEHRVKQRYILATLYYATQGDEWTERWYWLSHKPVCMWHGIRCDSTNKYVTRISFENNNLNGFIPYKLNSLVNLTDISLVNHHSLSCELDVFASLDRLKVLDLRYNNFHGILSSMSHMKRLRILYLEGNGLTGTIPSDIVSEALGKFMSFLFMTFNSCENSSINHNAW